MKAIDNGGKPFPLPGKFSVCRNVSNNSFLMLKLVLRILSFQETKMKLNFMFPISLVTCFKRKISQYSNNLGHRNRIVEVVDRAD